MTVVAWYWNQTGSTPVAASASNAWTNASGTAGNPAAGDILNIVQLPGVTVAPINFGTTAGTTYGEVNFSAGLPTTYSVGAQDLASADDFGFWVINATVINIGVPVAASGNALGSNFGQGPGRIKLNTGTVACTVNVFSTGNSLDTGLEPVRILANNASTVVNVLGGTVGIGTNLPGDTSTIGTAVASGSNSNLDVGPGVTATTVQVANSATAYLESSPATLTVAANATAYAVGLPLITTLNNYGTCNFNVRPASGAAITTLNTYGGSTFDASGNPGAFTVTNWNNYSSASSPVKVQKFQANANQITLTNPINDFGGGLMTLN